MKKLIGMLCLLTVVFARDLTQYVNPFIGTDAHGHTYPGATMPFGMVQISPDTRTGNWDACGGYHYSDDTILGFSHQHLSGVGCLDYGDVLFMPFPGKIGKQLQSYTSKFNHSSEKAEPGYYSVFLDDNKVKAELTATTRAGFHRYSFEKGGEQNLLIDLDHNLEENENIYQLEIKKISDTEIQGFRRTQGWAVDQRVYFVAKFSKPIDKILISSEGKNLKEANAYQGKSLKAIVCFKDSKENELLAKVGISAVDYDGARKNLDAEIPHWKFDKICKAAKKAWNRQLSKIEVTSSNQDDLIVFYTSLYHSSIVPNIYFDVDRRYRGNDQKIHTCKDFDNYTVFSLWDTFRATHPLFTIIDQKRAVDFINTFQKVYHQTGVLPKWELAGNETGTMIGYHSVSAIVDAYVKGLKGFDKEKIFEAMKNTANQKSLEMDTYRKFGYLPMNRHESVSKTLEYAYDDWCISVMAEALEKSEDHKAFTNRAYNYQNVYDGATGFMRGKKENGNRVKSFDPFSVSREFTEANAWQYSLFAPHDVKGLVNLHGSEENFVKHLDNIFSTKSPGNEQQLSDITGLIGQYAHGNEPSHHMAYLYNYVNQPWKTQTMINQINDEMYTTKPDGISGNEDCGQMSAWYLFSSMGFYPFCPGTDEYLIGTPKHKVAKINLENGKSFVVKANNLSKDNYYIQSAKLNGKTYNLPFIKHADIMNGGELVFEMGNKPDKNWGVLKNTKPYSMTKSDITSIPYLTGDDVNYFTGKVKIGLDCTTSDVEIHYTLDGTEPTEASPIYKKPFEIDETTIIKARAFSKSMKAGAIMSTTATKAEFLEAVKVGKLEAGVRYDYYEGEYSSVFDMDNAEVKKSGKLKDINLDEAEIEDHYGFIYTGYIKMEADGIYEFYTKSDDGSVLFIDGKKIVDNDGSHAAIIASNLVALKKGYHKFELKYIEDYEGNSVEFGYKGKDNQYIKLSGNQLFREK